MLYAYYKNNSVWNKSIKIHIGREDLQSWDKSVLIFFF